METQNTDLIKPITIELSVVNALENYPFEIDQVYFQFENEPSPVQLIQDQTTVITADIESISTFSDNFSVSDNERTVQGLNINTKNSPRSSFLKQNIQLESEELSSLQKLSVVNALENYPFEIDQVYFQFENEPSPVQLIQDQTTVITADIEPISTFLDNFSVSDNERTVQGLNINTKNSPRSSFLKQNIQLESEELSSLQSNPLSQRFRLPGLEYNLIRETDALELNKENYNSSTIPNNNNQNKKFWNVLKASSHSNNCVISNVNSTLTKSTNGLEVNDYTLKIDIEALTNQNHSYINCIDHNSEIIQTDENYNELSIQQLQDDIYLLNKRATLIERAFNGPNSES
ncbi:hypothetical protein BB561_004745 [Smittium simulii]|uniref:Uncharacterized protein n=1 Tax=Smittium simulii TaxID=133385 RepID=A0A2T9YEJ7_9FUNG|nr:hypothetical protein BB561_004745 [Smittium simulii]